MKEDLLNMIRKNDYYGFYKTDELRLIYLKENHATFITSDSRIGQMYEFYIHLDGGETYYTLQIPRNNTYSAYQLENFCTYKGYKFYLENYWEGLFIISPNSREVAIAFGNYNPYYQDIRFEVKEEELEEIWEEREPVKGFIFDVEPIVYLKRKSN